MPVDTFYVRPTQSGPGSAGGAGPPPETGWSPDLKYVHDLLAGRVRPHALPPPKAVDESLERLAPGREPPRWLRDDFTLQFHYAGQAVACFQPNPTDELAVLAVGERQIGELLKNLSDDEVARIVIRYPELRTERGLEDDAVSI